MIRHGLHHTQATAIVRSPKDHLVPNAARGRREGKRGRHHLCDDERGQGEVRVRQDDADRVRRPG